MPKQREATYLDPQLDVDEAKLRFLQAAEEFSLMAPVQAHPFISLGSAFLLGIGASKITRNTSLTLAAVAQLAGAAAQFAPLFLRTRS